MSIKSRAELCREGHLWTVPIRSRKRRQRVSLYGMSKQAIKCTGRRHEHEHVHVLYRVQRLTLGGETCFMCLREVFRDGRLVLKCSATGSFSYGLDGIPDTSRGDAGIVVSKRGFLFGCRLIPWKWEARGNVGWPFIHYLRKGTKERLKGEEKPLHGPS